MSHIPGSFSSAFMGMWSYKNLLLGWMEMLVEFSVFFFLLGWEWGKGAKGRLLQDSGGWRELKGIKGVCRTERGFGDHLTGYGKVSSSPFSGLSILSSAFRMWQSSQWHFWHLFQFPQHLPSLAPSAPTVVVSPLLCLVLHSSYFVICLGLGKSQESLQKLGCEVLLLMIAFHHPPVTWLGLVCLQPSGGQCSMFAPAEKHRQYSTLKGLFFCLCPLLLLTTSIPEAVPAQQPVMSKVLHLTPLSRGILRDRQYLYI